MTATIKVIYDHPDFIIVDKPQALSFHMEMQTDGLAKLIADQTGLKLWPVHRLDKITSGLVIFAKSAINAALFGKLFEMNRIEKTYLALSDKKPKKKMGIICGDMQKSRNGSWKITHSKLNPATTQFVSCGLQPGIRLFLIKPKTGKTHQIRVALKSIGAAILGDTRYAGTDSDRGYLHAYALAFDWKEQRIELQCMPLTGALFADNQLLDKVTTMSNQLDSN